MYTGRDQDVSSEVVALSRASHSPQGGHLPEELWPGLSGASHHLRAGGPSDMTPACAPIRAPWPIRRCPASARLAADLNEVFHIREPACRPEPR